MKKWIWVLGIILLIGTILFVSSKNPKDDKLVYSEKNNFNEIIEECSKLSLFGSSDCFVGNTKNFFNYSNNEDFLYIDSNNLIWFKEKDGTSKSINDEEIFQYLKQNGGVCLDWSIYYLELCRTTSFQCNIIIEQNHSYLIMNDGSSFCKLDQLNLNCGELL